MMGRAGEQFATTTRSPTESLSLRAVVQPTEVCARFLGNLLNCALVSVFGALDITPCVVSSHVTDIPRLVNNVHLLCVQEGFIHSEKSIPDV